jgi:hypothetical protein
MSQIWPKLLLKEIGRKHPQAWQQIKRFRAIKGKDLPNWPDWCYVPMAAGYAIISQGVENPHIVKLRISPAVLTAAATWRVSQGVYRFDADLYNSLVNQPMDDKLPCDALKRLPEWCVYIETIGASYLGKPIDGFCAHLEWDANDGRTELRFVFFYPDGNMAQLPLHLGDWTIEEGIDRMYAEAKVQAQKTGIKFDFDEFGAELAPEITPFLQLILYLCAENADMPEVRHPNTRVRMSGQVDVPREPRAWTVGERIGTTIRKYRNQETREALPEQENTPDTHSSPRPHVRRAHWHHFWTGPRGGERKLIIRWLPPIPVGFDDDGENPAVIHRVK